MNANVVSLERGYPEVERPTQPLSLQRVVSGRITLEGFDRGVSNLIVEALDVSDNDATTRMGSVSTDGTGTFRIEVAAAGDQLSRAWNLQLVVLAPERANRDRENRQLYRSEVREHAGQSEYFHIELSVEALKSVGIEALPAANAAADAAVTAIKAAHV